MSDSFSGPGLLPFLYQQHRYCIAELGRTHHVLSKLYRKLAKVERTLAERKERMLARRDKKKLQWTRARSMQAVNTLEQQQVSLHDRLYLCNEMIAAFDQNVHYYRMTASARFSQAVTPYTVITLPSACSTNLSQPGIDQFEHDGPRYWDLSMLQERSQSPITQPAQNFEHQNICSDAWFLGSEEELGQSTYDPADSNEDTLPVTAGADIFSLRTGCIDAPTPKTLGTGAESLQRSTVTKFHSFRSLSLPPSSSWPSQQALPRRNEGKTINHAM